MISLTKDKRMLGYESLSSYANISHFVTTRHGGCSEGTYASFNCAPYSGDDAEKVRQNQMILVEELWQKPGKLWQKPKELVIPFQTHETKCLLIDDVYVSASSHQRQELLHGVDALITREPGYCLCISTADCVPVLVYDKKQGAIAAIHAGWRGTVASIVRDVLLRMKEEFGTSGEDVIACIGPSISFASFEVGEEVYEAFQKNGFDMPRISMRKEETGKYHIDLWEANRMQLLAFGVPTEQVELAQICTYIHHEEFFSARRLGIKSGRILSGIMLHERTQL